MQTAPCLTSSLTSPEVQLIIRHHEAEMAHEEYRAGYMAALNTENPYPLPTAAFIHALLLSSKLTALTDTEKHQLKQFNEEFDNTPWARWSRGCFAQSYTFLKRTIDAQPPLPAMNPIPKDRLLDKVLDIMATHFRVTKQKVWNACMMGTLPDHILSEGHMHIPGMSLRSLQYLLSHVLRAQKANAKTPIDPTFAPKVPIVAKKPTVKRRP